MNILSIIIICAIISILTGLVVSRFLYDDPCETCRYYTPDCNCDETPQSYNQVKGVLSLAFMDYLDKKKPEGKMCLSNGECADIDKAFEEQDWKKLFRYIQKYGT